MANTRIQGKINKLKRLKAKEKTLKEELSKLKSEQDDLKSFLLEDMRQKEIGRLNGDNWQLVRSVRRSYYIDSEENFRDWAVKHFLAVEDFMKLDNTAAIQALKKERMKDVDFVSVEETEYLTFKDNSNGEV